MAVAAFNVAVDRMSKEKKADFPKVTVFGRQAENCERYLSKGSKVLVPIDVQGAQVSVLLRERLFLACPRPFSLEVFSGDENAIRRAREEGADLRLFSGQPFILLKTGNRIRAMLEHYSRSVGFLPRILLETENIETAFALARQGMGITVYPELFLRALHAEEGGADSSLDLFPLPGEGSMGALAVAFLESGYRSPAVLDFIALCRRQSGLWGL